MKTTLWTLPLWWKFLVIGTMCWQRKLGFVTMFSKCVMPNVVKSRRNLTKCQHSWALHWKQQCNDSFSIPHRTPTMIRMWNFLCCKTKLIKWSMTSIVINNTGKERFNVSCKLCIKNATKTSLLCPQFWQQANQIPGENCLTMFLQGWQSPLQVAHSPKWKIQSKGFLLWVSLVVGHALLIQEHAIGSSREIPQMCLHGWLSVSPKKVEIPKVAGRNVNMVLMSQGHWHLSLRRTTSHAITCFPCWISDLAPEKRKHPPSHPQSPWTAGNKNNDQFVWG